MNRQIGPKRPGTEWSAFRHGCSSGRIFLRVLNFILCFFLNRCTPWCDLCSWFFIGTSIYSMDIMILHIFWFLWCTAWSFLPIFQAQVVRRSVTNKKRQSVTTLNSKLCLLPSLKQKKSSPHENRPFPRGNWYIFQPSIFQVRLLLKFQGGKQLSRSFDVVSR